MGKVKWYGKRVLAVIEGATPDALYAAGEQLIAAAASKAPRRSGDLIDSAYVTGAGKSTYRRDGLHNKEAQVEKGAVAAGFAAFYARFHELGTKNQPAKPFLRPALDETANHLGATIVKSIRRKVDK